MKPPILFVVVTLAFSYSQPVGAQPTSYKYRITQQVCQRLAVAFGEQRVPKLTLLSDPARQRIAQFVPKPEAELFLDEKLYDICRRFGPDSLAALSVVLGHELAHYYGKHADWFGFAQLVNRQQPTTVQAGQTQVLEAQADMQGVYRAFLAGYDVHHLVKPLYTAIYSAYHLPDQMQGYPSRDERIRMMDEQARKASTLAIAFDTGLFFLLKQEYANAQRCFEFVSEEIPTKELLNNVGLCLLLRVAQVMTPREMPFRYPFEVETGNRLRQTSNRGDEGNKTALLKLAISYFQQAIDLNETYATAYINLASAQSMLGRTGTAKETIDQLEEELHRTNEALPTNARLIRGIALVEAGNITVGITELEQSPGAYELAYNLDVARNYTNLITQPVTPASERLAQLASRHVTIRHPAPLKPEVCLGTIQLPFAATASFSERLSIPEPGLVRIQSQRVANGILYQIRLATGRYDVICSLPDQAAQSSLGLSSGDSVQKLTTLYGEPQRIVAANGLTYYCYDPANFFVAVRNNLVINWLIYITSNY